MSGPRSKLEATPVDIVSEAMAATENTIPATRHNILCRDDLNLRKTRAATQINIGIIPMR